MLHRFLLLFLLLAAAGCGDWPPIVNKQEDIHRLPASQKSIRARGLSDSDIPALNRFRELQILDFSGGYAVEDAKITDEGLRRLARLDLRHLQTLTLGHCDHITDEGLKRLSKMDSVQWLGLPASPLITDAGLSSLLDMASLTGLDLRGCPGITDAGLSTLAQKQDWDLILLGGCPNVTAAGVAELQRTLPNSRVKKDDVEWSRHGKN